MPYYFIALGHKKRGKNENSTPFNIQYPMKNLSKPNCKIHWAQAQVDESGK